jgi:hypothetical protein
LVGGVALSRALLGGSLILSEDMNQRGHQWRAVAVAGVLVATALIVVGLLPGRAIDAAGWAIAGLGAALAVTAMWSYCGTASMTVREMLAAGRPLRLVTGIRRSWVRG